MADLRNEVVPVFSRSRTLEIRTAKKNAVIKLFSLSYLNRNVVLNQTGVLIPHIMKLMQCYSVKIMRDEELLTPNSLSKANKRGL